MKARRLFILALVLLLAVALMTTALVACNPDKGEDTTGENPDAGETPDTGDTPEMGDTPDTGETPSTGDAIFTEDATLAEIKAALKSAESYTYYFLYESSSGSVDETTFSLTHEKRSYWNVYTEDGVQNRSEGYFYIDGQNLYNVNCVSGKWRAVKDMLSNVDDNALPDYEYDYYYNDGVLSLLMEVDGKIMFNPEDIAEGASVESPCVVMDGDELKLTFVLHDESGDSYKETHILKLVNATEVVVPENVLEIAAAAQWAEDVQYNGVQYVKVADETTGEEFYYVVYILGDATPEATINGLPVVTEDSTPAFTESSSLAEIIAAMKNADSYVLEVRTLVCTEEGDFVSDGKFRYLLTENAVCVLESSNDYSASSDVTTYTQRYRYIKGDVFYVAKTNLANNVESFSKNLVANTDESELPLSNLREIYLEALNYLYDDNGTVAVDGDGRVTIGDGTLSLHIRCEENEPSGTQNVCYIYNIEYINSVTVTVPPEVVQQESGAEWRAIVEYNGISYSKAVDETTGEEYYYVAYAPDGATPETTINTLPVKPRQ